VVAHVYNARTREEKAGLQMKASLELLIPCLKKQNNPSIKKKQKEKKYIYSSSGIITNYGMKIKKEKLNKQTEILFPVLIN
jgi:hypothetical protein